jgi:hypothetical protein
MSIGEPSRSRIGSMRDAPSLLATIAGQNVHLNLDSMLFGWPTP